jgi:SNF2 family DNA or RNA helicase
MGLGKTVQALALICHARAAGAIAPFLVIAPTSVVHNWVNEAARFAPDLTVHAVTQSEIRRGTDLAEAVTGADVVVTSYTLFRLEFDGYRGIEWAGLVLDEAQFVKNPQSRGHRCARELPVATEPPVDELPPVEVVPPLAVMPPPPVAVAQIEP